MLVDPEGLGELVEREEGMVHLREKAPSGANRFRAILTDAQLRSRRKRDLEVARILGGGDADQPAHQVESVLRAMREQGESHLSAFVRPRTKKALREAVATSPDDVFLEETSAFGNEFEGWLGEAPRDSYGVVGPNPGRRRDWFAAIRWSPRKNGWVVE